MFYADTFIIFLFFYNSVLFYGPPIARSTTDIYFVTVGILFVPIIATSIKILKHWYVEQQKSLQLIQEKTSAELEQLKGQINPHFLFNTLNSLYALALKKSDQTPAALLKLSGILDYLLYECKAETVSLDKEIKLLKDYIELEKLRYGDRLDLRFKVRDSNTPLQIPPMLLLPFVENGFKHGASQKRENVWIIILLKAEKGRIYFSMQNSAPERNESQKQNRIGIANVRKRLDLLFDDQYNLTIESADLFSVKLDFPVSEGETF
jgi:sensor histidine kinase YesM